MEDEAQKMVALKKAYADIILNTAKEAAARIMASERKALRFQHDLSAARDEALRMLLRLKQMLDSQTTEAELKSLSQQRRIDELEAQLQEAEDVITDLRAELKRTGDELENAKRNQVQTMNEKVTHEDASFSEKLSPFPSSGCETMATSDFKNVLTNPRVMGDKGCYTVKQTERLSASDTDGFDPAKSDLASMLMMRSKKPELYRNGCTQRIRAFDRNVVNGKLPPDDDNFPMENEKEAFGFSHNSAVIESGKNLSQGERKKPGKGRTFRRKKTRFGKAKTIRRCHQPSSDSLHPKPSSRSAKEENSDEGECTLSPTADSTQASDELRESLRRDNQDEFKIFNKGKRKRNVKKNGNDDSSSTSPSSGQLAKPCQPSPVLSRCRTFAYFVEGGGIKSMEDGQSKSTENVAEKDSSAVVEDNSRLSGSSELNAAETTEASPLKCGLENVKVPERVNEEPPLSAENNRVLKYTFQRKRKRETTSSPDGFASPEKISATQEPSLMDESSRDSRRLAQVARQLISLSGKRWR